MKDPLIKVSFWLHKSQRAKLQRAANQKPKVTLSQVIRDLIGS